MEGFGARGGWWVVGQAALLAAVAASLLTGGDDWGPVGRIGGGALVAAGVMLAGSGLVTLGDSLSPFPSPRSGGALVERGVYRLVRHPIYGGIALGGLGLGVYDGNPLTIWGATGLTLYLWAKAGREEARLLSHFPDYAGYRERVSRRMIPWLI
jgi:protein-S-isoprenylcysteine O-methyltransferase Ste14